jgi:hypothetical protein
MAVPSTTTALTFEATLSPSRLMPKHGTVFDLIIGVVDSDSLDLS